MDPISGRFGPRAVADSVASEEVRRGLELDRTFEAHYIYTAPPAGDASNALRQTHAAGEENRIWLAPFELHGARIQVRRIAAAVGVTADGEQHDAGWAMRLYSYSKPPKSLSKEAPLESMQGELTLLTPERMIRKALNSPLRLTTTSTEQTFFRCNIDLEQDLLLRPGVQYAVGFQSLNEHSLWHCPGPTLAVGAIPMAAARKTRVTGQESFGVFPPTLYQQITPNVGEIVPMPSIVLWSAYGVHIYDAPNQGFGDDIGHPDETCTIVIEDSTGDWVFQESTGAIVVQGEC